ncbi:MAG TPA: NTP transferase domain-containing protein, partial [Candidatus Bathyarchaeia archaeon]
VATGEYILLVPFDTPFISQKVALLLFELCVRRSAVIPRWPNGQIEPLHAVYRTEIALKAAKSAADSGRLDMRAMIERMPNVRFVSTLVIEQLDPKLESFFNVNTVVDLKKARAIAKVSKVR